MVHTLPPWTTKYKMVTVFGNIDDAELAARLGSIVRYDRRGKVIFYDDFEAPVIHWSDHSYYGASTYYLSSLTSDLGSQCVCFAPDAAKNSIAGIRRYFPLPPTTRLGFEVAFWHTFAKLETWIYISIFDGTTEYLGTITYNGDDETIKIDSSGGDTTVASGVVVPTSYHCFNHMKVVVDYSTKKFVRLIFNDTEYDISTHSMDSGGSGNDPHIRIYIRTETKSTVARLAYIDNFIMTYAEE